MTDLYDVLGVARDASPEDIKSAYRAKAKGGAHPDHGGSTRSFALVKLAFDTLHDRERRERYDRTGTAEEQTPDLLEVKAMQTLFAALAQQLAQADTMNISYERVNLLGGVKDVLRSQRRSAEQSIDAMKSALKKKETLPPLFRSLDGKPNRLSAMIDAENRKLADAINANSKQLEVLDRAIQIADEHGFDYSPQQMPVAMFYFT